MVIFFAALGLPGLCGFIGEFFVVLGAWSYSKALAIVAASVVILTAGYILWTIQRVYLGPEYKGPHAEALGPMTRREMAIAAPLVALAILFGVYPRALFNYITPSVEKTVVEMRRMDADRPIRPHGLHRRSSPHRGADRTVNFDELVQSVVKDTIGRGSLWAFRPELALCATIVAMLLAKVVVPGWKTSAFLPHAARPRRGDLFRLACPGTGLSRRRVRGRHADLHRHAGLPTASRVVLRVPAAAVCDPVHHVHADGRRRRPGRHDRVLRADARRAGGHVPDDLGQPHVDRAAWAWRWPACRATCWPACSGNAQEQRGRPEVRRVRRRHGRRDALRHEPAGGRARLGPPADHDRSTGRVDPKRRRGRSNDGPGPRRADADGGRGVQASAVPFHFWAPDVFEGATAEVAAFLSVASKAAALGLLVRLATGFSFPAACRPARASGIWPRLAPVRQYIVALIFVLAAVTCTFGNLAAYGQTNMKRLLAYSTIAHAGYMMMPVAAAVALVGTNLAERPATPSPRWWSTSASTCS